MKNEVLSKCVIEKDSNGKLLMTAGFESILIAILFSIIGDFLAPLSSNFGSITLFAIAWQLPSTNLLNCGEWKMNR